jgi:hypothetical protein
MMMQEVNAIPVNEFSLSLSHTTIFFIKNKNKNKKI